MFLTLELKEKSTSSARTEEGERARKVRMFPVTELNPASSDDGAAGLVTNAIISQASRYVGGEITPDASDTGPYDRDVTS
jgi:hypothetical protein